MAILAFCKKAEENDAKCEILKFSTALLLNSPSPSTLTTQKIDAEQALEFIIEVKEDSSRPMSAVRVFVPYKIRDGKVCNKTETFLEPDLPSNTRYSCGYAVNRPARLVKIDCIDNVLVLPENEVSMRVISHDVISEIVVQFLRQIQPNQRVGVRMKFDVQEFATYSADILTFGINIFSKASKYEYLLQQLRIDETIIRAKKIIDKQTRSGGFDIHLALPADFRYETCSHSPAKISLLSYEAFSNKGTSPRQVLTWRARLLISEDKETIGLGDSIDITGNASDMTKKIRILGRETRKSTNIGIVALILGAIGVIIAVVTLIVGQLKP